MGQSREKEKGCNSTRYTNVVCQDGVVDLSWSGLFLFYNNGLAFLMTKKKQSYSNAGKGDKSRVSNKKKYDENWDKIFKKQNKD